MFDQVLSRHGTLPEHFFDGGVVFAANVPPRGSRAVEAQRVLPGLGPMFGQVLSRREALRECHYRSGAVIAAMVYAGVVAFGAWAQTQVRAVDRQDVVVNFITRPLVRPPAPPRAPTVASAPPVVARAPAGPKLKAPSDKPHVVLSQVIVAPTEIPAARPAESDATSLGSIDAGEASAADPELAAVPGGITGAVVDAADVVVVEEAARPPAFQEATMTHPRFVSGPTPQYTQKALEREVEGTIEVRCIVTAQGRVKDCRIVRSLPFMDRAVIEALERRVYAPATLDGQAIDVYYRFKIPLRLSD